MNNPTYNPCDECRHGIDRRDGSGSAAMCNICEFQTLLNKSKLSEKSSNKVIDRWAGAVFTFTNYQKLRTELIEDMRMRMSKKMGTTDRAMAQLLNRLGEVAGTDDEKLACVREATAREWKSFYPVQMRQQAKKQQADKPKVRSYDMQELEQMLAKGDL